MATGSLPALNTAFRLIIMPQGIIGQALGIAAFPTLSSLAARGEKAEMRQIFADSLRILLFLGLPFSVLFAVLGQPIVSFLFERGVLGDLGTQFVSWALLFYALGLVPLLALEVVARTFYALSDTLTPVLAGGVQIVIMWLLSLWFSQTVFHKWVGCRWAVWRWALACLTLSRCCCCCGCCGKSLAVFRGIRC